MKRIDSVTYSKRTEEELQRASDHVKGQWYTVKYYDERKDALVYALNIPLSGIVGQHPFKVVRIIARACVRFILDFLNRVNYE